MHRHEERDHRILRILPILALIALPLTAQPPCDDVLEFVVGTGVTTLHRQPLDASAFEVIRLNFTEGDVLELEAVSAAGAASPARLLFLGTDCTGGRRPGTDDTGEEGDSWIRLDETPAVLRLQKLRDNDAFVAVISESPDVPLSEYLLYAVPSRRTVRLKVDPIEDDEESELNSGESCTLAGDHSGRSSCGTHLPFGHSVAGAIDNGAGIDMDVFEFFLETQWTVAVDVLGADGIKAILFDDAGQQLAAWPSGRLVRTLGPGVFRVRVGSTAPWSEYTVTLTTP